MKLIMLTLFSLIFLSSCALYSGLKNKPDETPKTVNGKTISTPPPARSNPASMEQNNATTTAGKMISPIVQ